MFRLGTVTISFFYFMGSVAIAADHSGTYTPPVPTMNGDLNISLDQLVDFESRALNGDGLEALKLSIYFRVAKNDPIEQEYWATIAAEDGNTVGEVTLGSILNHKSAREPDPQLRRPLQLRAIYWTNQALRNSGVDKETELLTRVHAMERELNSNLR